MTIPIDSPQTFELEAEIYGWYTEKNKLTTSRKYIKLRTHRCTREELGFEPQGGSQQVKNREQAKFSPITQDQAYDVYRMIGQWQCFDEDQDDEIELLGNANSGTAQTLRFNLKKCNSNDSNTECDSSIEQGSYFNDKWIAFLSDEKTFNSITNEVQQESIITWLPVQAIGPMSISYEVFREELKQEESLFKDNVEVD